MRVCSLNSGSNGNCYYVGSSATGILVDIGLSCRETVKRLEQAKINIDIIKAIFISHEHGDHIKGVSVFANKYNIPVYVTPLTARKGPVLIKHISHSFENGQPIVVGDLVVTPFAKKHDAAHPHSFIVAHEEHTIGVITDIGIACENTQRYFAKCTAAFLESNYDVEMLQNGRYPQHLKNRISDGEGHISNVQALELFQNHRNSKLTHLFLSHLSRENNSPELALATFTPFAEHVNVMVASRYEVSCNVQLAQPRVLQTELF